MAAKTYEIAFKIAGQLSSNFAKTFKNAGDAVNGFHGRMGELNREAANVGNVIKLREEGIKLAKTAANQRKALDAVRESIKRSKEPTVEQIKFEKALSAQYNKTKTALDKKRKTLKNAEEAANSNGQSLKKLIDRQKELEKQSERVRAIQEKLAKINERSAKAQDVQGKARGMASVGNVQMAAVGGAAMGAGGYMLKVGSEYGSAMAQMQASTGLTTAEMQKLGQSARDVYKSGVGQSFEEVTQAMATIRQTSGLTGDALKQATNGAMVLRDVFQMEVNESARASAALMKNFGIEGSKAHDLIAYAAQRGANKNGDLLDTFNEYSVQYKALGFSAEQFTAHLIQGAKDGAFSIDKVGDAIKEFNIRAKDGSKTSTESFEALGLNAAYMTQSFAQGGKTAQQAFFEVVKRLNDIEDPVKRNAAAVGLFGTQFEDLEAGALKGMLSLKGATLETAGTLRSIQGVKYDTLGSQIEIISRKFRDAMIPASTQATTAIKANMPQISASIAKLAPSIAAFGSSFAGMMPGIINGLNGAIQKATAFANTIANNWSWIGPIVSGVVKAFIGFKVLAYLTSLGAGFYRTLMMLHKGFTLVRNSSTLATAATKAWRVATVVARGSVKALTVGVRLFGVAMKGLFLNPVGLAVLAIAGLVAAGVALYKNWDTVKAKIKELWATVSNFFGKIGNTIANAWEKAKGFFGSAGKKTVELVTRGASFVGPQMASGGIVTKPTLAMIGEGRESEAVLPLSKLDGLMGSRPSGVISVNFAPVINITGGGADAYSQVKRGLDEGSKNLEKDLDRLVNKKRRLSFT